MPRFSNDSLSKLQTCHIDLQTIFFEVIKNFDCSIIEGHRNQADQEADFKAGKTQLHYPNGNHNAIPSNAVDSMGYLDNGKGIEWDKPTNTAYFAGYVMATAQQLKNAGKVSHGLRYGGNWKGDHDLADNHFCDNDHYELVP